MKFERIKEELDNCKNPLFIFDDDPDGLSSFLVLRKYKGCGKFLVVKTTPILNQFFATKVKEYNPDKIFVLDIAMIDEDFFNNVKVPIIWIDHHTPQEDIPSHCKYFNPKIKMPDSYFPTSYLVYQAIKENSIIASVGCISDAMIPDFLKEVPKKLLNKQKDVWDIRFNSDLGKLCAIYSFAMKGSTTKAKRSIDYLIKIEDHTDLLNPTLDDSKRVINNIEDISKEAEKIKAEAKKVKAKNKFFIFIYKSSKYSVTKELSNELSYEHPNKIVIVGRDRSGSIKMSIRSKDIPILPIIEKIIASNQINLTGGGHPLACGAVVESNDFDKFLELFENYL